MLAPALPPLSTALLPAAPELPPLVGAVLVVLLPPAAVAPPPLLPPISEASPASPPPELMALLRSTLVISEQPAALRPTENDKIATVRQENIGIPAFANAPSASHK